MQINILNGQYAVKGPVQSSTAILDRKLVQNDNNLHRL